MHVKHSKYLFPLFLENYYTIPIFILIVHYGNKILFLISIFFYITKHRYIFILSYNLRTESYLKKTWNEKISKKEIKEKKKKERNLQMYRTHGKGRKNFFFFFLDSRTSSICRNDKNRTTSQIYTRKIAFLCDRSRNVNRQRIVTRFKDLKRKGVERNGSLDFQFLCQTRNEENPESSRILPAAS